MFARRYNEVHVTMQIAPIGPLIVKEGRHIDGGDRNQRSFHPDALRDPPRPRRRDGHGYGTYASKDDTFDMACVWTRTANGPRFYLPGSSLRGVLRATIERLVGRWQPEWTRAADPFDTAAQRWTLAEREREAPPSSADIYRMCGPVERCFGHTTLRGRWRVDDAAMPNEQAAHVVVRDGVGIDRRTGAAANNVKFQYEAITGGVFETTLTLINYELWQLGLLAHALALLDDGHSRLGYGTRRGLGQVRLAITDLRFVWYGARPEQLPDGVRLPTLAAQAGNAAERYGIRDAECAIVLALHADLLAVLGSVWQIAPTRAVPLDQGFRPTNWDEPIWASLAAPLDAVLANWPIPAALRPFIAAEAGEAVV